MISAHTEKHRKSAWRKWSKTVEKSDLEMDYLGSDWCVRLFLRHTLRNTIEISNIWNFKKWSFLTQFQAKFQAVLWWCTTMHACPLYALSQNQELIQTISNPWSLLQPLLTRELQWKRRIKCIQILIMWISTTTKM